MTQAHDGKATHARQVLWVQGALAQALIAICHATSGCDADTPTSPFLPEKMNPVIRPIMETIKGEPNRLLQAEAASSLSSLLSLCVSRSPCPNSKIVKNLFGFLCCDPLITPKLLKASQNDEDPKILSLQRQNLTLRSSKVCAMDSPKETVCAAQSERHLQVQRHGAKATLEAIVARFGADLPKMVPSLWTSLLDSLRVSPSQEAINCLHVLKTLVPRFHTSLLSELTSLVPTLCEKQFLGNAAPEIRFCVSRFLGSLARVAALEVMRSVIEKVLPMLQTSKGLIDVVGRRGAVEAVYVILEELGLAAVPFLVILVLPVLAAMSDLDEAVRLMATQSFALVVKLMPLDRPEEDNGGTAAEGAETGQSTVVRKSKVAMRENGTSDASSEKTSLSAFIQEHRRQDRKFLDQLLHPRAMDDYPLLFELRGNTSLRKYQQEGVNWMAFLNRYKLHGILCDDMGLGKTLMSISMLANSHFQYSKTDTNSSPTMSLVVCPPTLTGHWMDEILKFVSKDVLNPVEWIGAPAERTELQNRILNSKSRVNIIITSYEIIRNDISYFGSKVKEQPCY
jgi:TATA-binding protein-associated factor